MSQRLAAHLEALYARASLGMRLGLDAMVTACATNGHPECSFPAVHVAGTNGKGSVCAMVESIARASGLKTGMYTSPHLVRFAERIRIDGEPLPDDDLVSVLERALDADLSFFETATLAAFLAFRDHRVDLAVIEVGIGGRLDATNVLPAETVRCSAVTKVAFDHMDKLGNSLAMIASEKAAIARRGTPLVHGAQPPDVMEVLRAATAAAGAPAILASPYTGELGLEGRHQRYNAGIAAAIAGQLKIPSRSIEEGIAGAKWPGRMERIVTRDGIWLLDGAHNPDGMAALISNLRGLRVGAVIFGALADKEWPAMLAELAAVNAPRIYVAPGGRAPAPFEALDSVAPGRAVLSLADALTQARQAAGKDLVVVCGSLYLVGSARAALLGLSADPVVAL